MRIDGSKLRVGWIAAMGICLFFLATSRASACFLCALSDGTMSCSQNVGETGGSSCLVNCKTTAAGTDVCFCRTLGICGGSNGCDGHPCPQVAFKSEKASSIPGRTFLTRETLSAVAASDSEVADLLSGFVKDSDALELGLYSRAPFIPGEYHGLFSETPADTKGQTKAFRVEAQVVQELDRVVVDVQLFDHPRLMSVHAEIGNVSGNRVEVVDVEGHLSRIEM